MSEYYTPDIEDIRVGYECEQLIDYITHNEWKKEIFGKGCWLPEGDVGGIMHWYHTCIINKRLRTAYLTKEQIIKEGWEEDEAGIYKGNVAIKLYPNLGVNGELTVIRIWQTMKNGNTLYLGKCPSINEFRMLTKLLHI